MYACERLTNHGRNHYGLECMYCTHKKSLLIERKIRKGKKLKMKKLMIIVTALILVISCSGASYAHSLNNNTKGIASVACPFCGGYSWNGSDCRGSIDVNSTTLETCSNSSHGPCSVTVYYYFTYTYCRDCGYPRQTSSVHRHSVYHSSAGAGEQNPMLVCIYEN